ncbi:hypothetical protein E2562_038801 [Oryza meyeriana var. granulata]|uniref:Pentacotripeptide-repeat region of PRORP domain-containing protein n=1 Tax=Oryza meyeriana var. granulata TaxID=110450 RepID=A0A6G1CM50_9ORYZ|nr:hypothetical protein E2562_038801 [Oryza meyeriana var. granulata]
MSSRRVSALGPVQGIASPPGRASLRRQQQEGGGIGSEHAHDAFDELLHRGSSSIYDLNRALSDVACDSPAVAVCLFNRMVARAKVTPNLCTYSIVSGCCSRGGQLDLAFATVGRVIRTGWRVDAITFNPLLKGLCVHDRTSEAMDIALRRMPDLGCTPNIFSYNILLKGLCDINTSQQALDLLHIMVMAGETAGGGCQPNVVSYNTVINGLLREGQVDKAYCLFDEMLDQGISPDVVTYSSIIATLSKSQAMDKATEVLTRMVKNGKPKEAIVILKKMCRHGVEPNVVTYNTLMDYLCKSGRSMEAREFFDSMVKRGHKPTIATYTTLLHGDHPPLLPPARRACPSVQVGLSLPGPRLNSVEDRHPADPSLRRGQGESGLNLAMVGHVTAAQPELGIHPFSPESFLLRFQNSAPGFKLSFRPWTRLSQASVGQLRFRVRIHLYGRNETLPAYLYWL